MAINAVQRLRARGFGEQALKAALAAGLAWVLGAIIPGAPPNPYLAPLTAMLTVQLTIADSITGAVHRTSGAIIGVIVAFLAGHLIGVNALTVVALVLVSQLVAALLKLNVVGTSQVMVTALLVLTIGGSTSLEYGWSRVAETVIGAVVGVVVNAFLVPPSHLVEAQRTMRTLIAALVDGLDALADALQRDGGLTREVAAERLAYARDVARQFESAHETLERAELSLRYNLLGARERRDLEEFRRKVQTVEHTAIQVRSLTRTLYDACALRIEGNPLWLQPDALGCALGDLIRASGGVLAAFGEDRDLAPSLREYNSCRERFGVLAQANVERLVPHGWEYVGAALATLERLVDDVAAGRLEADDAADAATDR